MAIDINAVMAGAEMFAKGVEKNGYVYTKMEKGKTENKINEIESTTKVVIDAVKTINNIVNDISKNINESKKIKYDFIKEQDNFKLEQERIANDRLKIEKEFSQKQTQEINKHELESTKLTYTYELENKRLDATINYANKILDFMQKMIIDDPINPSIIAHITTLSSIIQALNSTQIPLIEG